MTINKVENLLDWTEQTVKVTNASYKQIETDFYPKPNTAYSLTFDYEFIGEPVLVDSSKTLRIAGYTTKDGTPKRYKGKNFSNYTNGSFVYTFTTTGMREGSNLYFRIPEADTKFTCELHITNARLAEKE